MNKPKFRAWVTKNKGMYGVYGWNTTTNEIYLCSLPDSAFKDGVLHTVHSVVRSLDNVILMQYTGLKDNSKEPIEIWQKSIVKIVNEVGDYFIGVVDYFGDQGYPAFDIDCKYYKGWYFESNVLSEVLGNDELKIYVIGDVFSNPELLNEVE